VLSQAQKIQLTKLAIRDFGNNISMAASLHKLVEERDGYEKAEQAVAFYCKQQNIMTDVLEKQADVRDYQLSVEA
jgi:hypothetical protein